MESKDFKEGQTVKLRHSGLIAKVQEVTSTHVSLRFLDGSSGTYVLECVKPIKK
jgi:hypothetical protein